MSVNLSLQLPRRIACAVVLSLAAFVAGAVHATTAVPADPASDAPEARFVFAAPVSTYASYEQALSAWRQPEDVNAWIGARFEYDMARAIALSESQRAAGPSPAIHAPADFHAQPRGVCVDLARFAVESLQQIAPGLRPRYLMVEFDPVRLQGQVLRRHWMAGFEREGAFWFFADSKRPGHLAGPYASVESFISEYAQYRGRTVVAHRLTDSHRRQMRSARAGARGPAED